MKIFQSIYQNQKLYLQNFQESLFLSNVFNKKFLTIKRYIFNIDSKKLGIKYHDVDNITNLIPKKNTIYNSDLFILDHFLVILCSNFNEILKHKSQSEIKSDIVTVPHYAFISINKNWHHSTTLISSEIPEYLHPEIIIRMINLHIKDNTFIDLLRRRLHLISKKYSHLNENIRKILSYYINSILYYFLEIEFDLFIKKEMCSLINEFQFIYNKKFSFLLKKKYLIPLIEKQKNTRKHILNNYFLNSIQKKCIKHTNYLRFKQKWILNIHNDIFIIKILRYRCTKFWKNRIGICLQNTKWNWVKFNHENFFFLGSVLKQNNYQATVAITFTNNHLLLKNQIKYKFLVIKMPIFHVIQILSKYGICDKSGYPISKSSWSTWSDLKIIDRFNQIFLSIYLYYNGCINRKKLSSIHYILCYSCGKTLACKHKTTLRYIWYQYSKKNSKINFFKKNQFYIKKYIDRQNEILFDKKITAWHFDYTDYDSIISLLIE